MKTFLILLTLVFNFCYSYSQINIGGKPYSFKNQIKTVKVVENQTPKIEFPKLDFEKLIKEDELRESFGPYRYGKVMKVTYDWNNSGEWIELENGDRLWRLTIYCQSAKSINLEYDKFWLPEGSLLYLYNKSKSTFIGGFSNINNKGSRLKPSGFATGLIFDDEITLEYYEPSGTMHEGIISISKIIYGYKNINMIENEICTINVNCSPEGNNWQDEKKSVALVFSNGGMFSGSLINNTLQNGILYFLTANHNITPTGHDAISNPDASSWLFCWEYETEGCNGSIKQYYYTAGATVISNDAPSDFALLRLIESPFDLSSQIQVYFNGWDRHTTAYNGSASIHHPLGLPKKISLENHSPTTFQSFFWKVQWDPSINGISKTYPGSSGAPLFSNYLNKRIIGQLYGSYENSSCNLPVSIYGKFHLSWDYGSEPRRRLKDWLDPFNSNVRYLDGTYCNNTIYITNTVFEEDTVINACSLVMENINILNNANILFSIANETILNGAFEVNLGSTISIK